MLYATCYRISYASPPVLLFGWDATPASNPTAVSSLATFHAAVFLAPSSHGLTTPISWIHWYIPTPSLMAVKSGGMCARIIHTLHWNSAFAMSAPVLMKLSAWQHFSRPSSLRPGRQADRLW